MFINIGIVVGEYSGDMLAYNFFKKFKHNFKIHGVIGPNLKKLNCNALSSINDLSIIGFTDPIIKLIKLLKLKIFLIKYFFKNIDIFIGVDCPDFNFLLEKDLKKKGIFIIHLVSPSLWAWRKYRIKYIKNNINLMISLFPFEIDIYKKYNIPIVCFGHPCANSIKIVPNKYYARYKLKIFDKKSIFIAMLPGSRLKEIKYHFPIYLNLINIFLNYHDFIKILFPLINYNQYIYIFKKYKFLLNKYKCKIIINKIYQVIESSDIIVASSGTIILESIFFKKETLVIYKMNILNYFIAKIFININYISLPNILMKFQFLKEYIQYEININNLYRELVKLIVIIKKNYIKKNSYLNFDIQTELKKSFDYNINILLENLVFNLN